MKSIRNKYIIYGVSEILLTNTLPKCKEKIVKENGEILYYCDSDSRKWNQDKNIYSPEKIKEDPEAIILILCSAVKEVSECLKNMGLKNMMLAYPHFAFSFCADEYSGDVPQINKQWINENEGKIKELYNLNDSYTQKILQESIEERKMEMLEFLSVERVLDYTAIPMYFYDDSISPKGMITFIDAGAYTGDSIELLYKKYKDNLKKVYAFEPNEENMKKMKSNLHEQGIDCFCECLKYGLFDKEGVLFFDDSKDSVVGHISDIGNLQINVVALDHIELDVQGDLLIKMDIEGSELKALQGAKNTIQRYTPYMAICVYHRMKDVLEIPEYINSVNPNYEFYLRAGSHLECYAVPKTVLK